MNIEKMRPKDIHAKILLLREKSGVEFFLKYNHEFVDIDCPGCSGVRGGEMVEFYKYGFSHVKCRNCNVLYVSPRPTQKMLFEYYREYEAPKVWNELLVETNRDRKYLQHIPRVKILKNILKKRQNKLNTFVDLGAGNGNFAKAIDEENIFREVIASDISEVCIESCKKLGLKTKKCSIEDFEDASLDCITFNDLIEHVFDPVEFIKECHKKLSADGILMLSTPNGEGFDFKILKEKTENITPPEHLQYFNPKSIRMLLERLNFNIVDISTPGILDVDIVKRQKNEKYLDLKNNEFIQFMYELKNDKIESNFQDFLQKSNLSSHLLVFASKS